MTAPASARRTIAVVNSAVNLVVLTIIVVLLAFAGFALWDSHQVFQAADRSHYAVYEPAKAGGKSFQELQALNPEVMAWLTVYGTNISYPVTQAADNSTYLNTDAEGRYSLAGALFLDYRNRGDFSDFNSIIYGHHMDKAVMFGQVGSFREPAMFDEHRYGDLYFDGTNHGIEFFAFIHADAYDDAVYNLHLRDADRRAYLDNLLAQATHTRDIGVTTTDRLVLLSTCSATSTNGRDILVGRITGQTYPDPFPAESAGNGKWLTGVDGRPGWPAITWWLAGGGLLVVAALVLLLTLRKKTCRQAKRGTS
ncbi:MAG: class B sortase [Propionibacteriaceae bacterium]|jgi:sortase B|nr:class B sortase [Propionibacteriaceae bacterium]